MKGKQAGEGVSVMDQWTYVCLYIRLASKAEITEKRKRNRPAISAKEMSMSRYLDQKSEVCGSGYVVIQAHNIESSVDTYRPVSQLSRIVPGMSVAKKTDLRQL